VGNRVSGTPDSQRESYTVIVVVVVVVVFVVVVLLPVKAQPIKCSTVKS